MKTYKTLGGRTSFFGGRGCNVKWIDRDQNLKDRLERTNKSRSKRISDEKFSLLFNELCDKLFVTDVKSENEKEN